MTTRFHRPARIHPVMEPQRPAHGAKASTTVELLSGTRLAVDVQTGVLAQALAREPRTLLFMHQRDGRGGWHELWLRAGSIAFVSEL